MKKHIVINGKVQGVGFRYWFSETAKQKNIYGWVRNKVSGEVEALFVGDDLKINDLLSYSSGLYKDQGHNLTNKDLQIKNENTDLEKSIQDIIKKK